VVADEPKEQMGIEAPVHDRPLTQTMYRPPTVEQHHANAHKEPVSNPLTMDRDDPRLGVAPPPIPAGAQRNFDLGLKVDYGSPLQREGRLAPPERAIFREADNRRFFLVTGAESAGNRHLVSLLVASGCAGAADHYQPFDLQKDRNPDWRSSVRWDWQTKRLYNASECFVMHRSLPHAFEWPKLDLLLAQLRGFGFRPHVLIPQRQDPVVAQSQVRRGHAPDLKWAARNIEMAKRLITTTLANQPETMPYNYVLHSDLQHPEYVRHLLAQCGRRMPMQQNVPRFRNTDSEYLSEEKQPVDLSVYDDADPTEVAPTQWK
jgi:hypothetical protein